MADKELGRTGIRVSRMALGCGTFGGIGSPTALIGHGLNEEAAFAAMDEAVALGITLFDTAYSYAGGASDRIVGRWMARRALEVGIFDAIDRLRERSVALGVGAGALALAWVMSHPLVTAPIAGPSRFAEHLRLLREALTVELGENSRNAIGALFAEG